MVDALFIQSLPRSFLCVREGLGASVALGRDEILRTLRAHFDMLSGQKGNVIKPEGALCGEVLDPGIKVSKK